MTDIIELIIEIILSCAHFEKLPKTLRWIALIVVSIFSITAVLLLIYFGLTTKNNLVLVLFLIFAVLITYFARKLIIEAIELTKR